MSLRVEEATSSYFKDNTNNEQCNSRCFTYVTTFISHPLNYLNCFNLTYKRFLSHGMLPLSDHDDVALFE